MSIHKAIERGDLNKVKQLLAAGAAVDERDRSGVTPLMVAVMYNLMPVFKALLQAGADVNAADNTGETVMHYAATHGTPTMVETLLEKKPDLNARNARGEPPLMGALSARTVELLLQAGADPNARRHDGLTLLDLCEIQRKAQGSSRESKISQLLRAAGAGAPPQAPTEAAPLRLPPKGTGPLSQPSPQDVEAFETAAATDDVPRLRQLLESGMPVDVRGEAGETALHRAAQRGCLGAVQMLLAAGAEGNARNAYGETPLHLAAQGNQAAAIRVLAQAGCDVNTRNSHRSTPLMIAADADAAEAAEALLAAGAAVNLANAQARTAQSFARSRKMKGLFRAAGADDTVAVAPPLDPVESLLKAADEGDVAQVRALLAAGVPVTAHLRYGETALHRAAEAGHRDVIRVLLDAGADLYARDREGSTILHSAVWSGNPGLVRFLLDIGLEVNAPDRHGFTPLMAAALQGQQEVAEVLLAAGADRSARGDYALDRRKTALDFARKIENPGQRRLMVELLKSAAVGPDPVEAAREAVPRLPEAAQQPAFQEMLRVVGEVCDKPATAWKKCPGVYQCSRFNGMRLAQRYGGGAAVQNEGRTARSSAERFYRLLERFRQEVRASGFQLVEPEANQDPRSAKFLLFPMADKYAVLAACQTNGANYGLGPDDIIAWLQEMESENPFVLTACGGDFVAGDFVKPVVHAAELAERMCEFCPDLLDGDEVEEPAQVAACLQESQSFFFWWD